MIVVPQFHSHLEPMKSLQYLDRQISFSYSENNVINLSGPFSSEVDPTRLVFNNSSDNKICRLGAAAYGLRAKQNKMKGIKKVANIR